MIRDIFPGSKTTGFQIFFKQDGIKKIALALVSGVKAVLGEGLNKNLFLPAVLEGEINPGPVRSNFVFIDGHVQLDYFGHPQVLKAFAGGFDGISGGFFPGILACPHNFDDVIYAPLHNRFLLSANSGSGWQPRKPYHIHNSFPTKIHQKA
jgi:prepilin-type processing-associated H-X9-DG protein